MATADVEIDMYSGVPNPGWPLADTQTANLLDMIAELPRTEASERPEGLGYRGITVRIHNDAVLEYHVHKGLIAVNGTQYADPDGRVERWLLDTGRPFLDESTYQLVESLL